jgi:murein DD-endopeptidase MepM/ murein hydrolase activator NlpD
MTRRKILSIIIIPEGAGEVSRTYRVPYRYLRIATGALIVVALILATVIVTWGAVVAQAARATALAQEVEALQPYRTRVTTLASQLQELEARYNQVRGLFGIDTTRLASDLWLPPPMASRSGSGRVLSDVESGLPTSWPLTERGFVTRPLLEGGGVDHPGMDIAVPMDSYVRASGSGMVMDVGEDEVYGRYVVVDHGNGYRTRYAHASQTLVLVGRRVRRNEVIALSGSSGRSTAPHLHFEILLDGEAVDPLTMVKQP